MDKKEKKFKIKDEKLNFGDIKEFLTAVIDFEEDSIQVNANDRYDFLQYTGLKDKNGKEIYEGDIIVITHQYMAGPFAQEDEYIGVVKFNESEFTLSDYKVNNLGDRPTILGDDITCTWQEDEYIDIPLSYFEKEELEDIEVISNIYINPGLLESD